MWYLLDTLSQRLEHGCPVLTIGLNRLGWRPDMWVDRNHRGPGSIPPYQSNLISGTMPTVFLPADPLEPEQQETGEP